MIEVDDVPRADLSAVLHSEQGCVLHFSLTKLCSRFGSFCVFRNTSQMPDILPRTIEVLPCCGLDVRGFDSFWQFTSSALCACVRLKGSLDLVLAVRLDLFR